MIFYFDLKHSSDWKPLSLRNDTRAEARTEAGVDDPRPATGSGGTKSLASGRGCGYLTWAELREDKMINPAPGFRPIFGPLGPTAGPGSLGTGSGSTIVQVAPKISPGDLL